MKVYEVKAYELVFKDDSNTVRTIRLHFLIDMIQQSYQPYVQLYPQHSYSRIVLNGLDGLLRIFPGKPIVDFSAPDLSGMPINYEYRQIQLDQPAGIG